MAMTAMEQRRTAAPTELPIIIALSLLVEDDGAGGAWEDEGNVDVLCSWDVVYDDKAGISVDETFVSCSVGLRVDTVDKPVE